VGGSGEMGIVMANGHGLGLGPTGLPDWFGLVISLNLPN